jgi:hypothetical protein
MCCAALETIDIEAGPLIKHLLDLVDRHTMHPELRFVFIVKVEAGDVNHPIELRGHVVG